MQGSTIAKRTLETFLRRTNQKTILTTPALTARTQFTNSGSKFPSVVNKSNNSCSRTQSQQLSTARTTATRFNEIKSNKNTFAAYLDSIKKPQNQCSRNNEEQLGIGVCPTDNTITMPNIVHDRAEVNNFGYFCKNDWKWEYGQNRNLDLNCPSQFPVHRNLDYINVRKTLAKQREEQFGPVHRLCQDFEEELLKQAEEKKKQVCEMRFESIERLERIREWQRLKLNEIRLAKLNDYNVGNCRITQETIGTQCESRKRKRIRELIAVKPRLLEPYQLLISTPSPQLLDSPAISPVISQLNSHVNSPNSAYNRVQTIFVKLSSEDSFDKNKEKPPLIQIEEEKQKESIKIKIDEFIQNIKSLEEVSLVSSPEYGTREKIPVYEKISKKEYMLIEPRAFCFGDNGSHYVTAEEYAQSLTFYRIDPKKLETTLNKLKEENMKSIKESESKILETNSAFENQSIASQKSNTKKSNQSELPTMTIAQLRNALISSAKEITKPIEKLNYQNSIQKSKKVEEKIDNKIQISEPTEIKEKPSSKQIIRVNTKQNLDLKENIQQNINKFCLEIINDIINSAIPFGPIIKTETKHSLVSGDVSPNCTEEYKDKIDEDDINFMPGNRNLNISSGNNSNILEPKEKRISRGTSTGSRESTNLHKTNSLNKEKRPNSKNGNIIKRSKDTKQIKLQNQKKRLYSPVPDTHTRLKPVLQNEKHEEQISHPKNTDLIPLKSIPRKENNPTPTFNSNIQQNIPEKPSQAITPSTNNVKISEQIPTKSGSQTTTSKSIAPLVLTLPKNILKNNESNNKPPIPNNAPNSEQNVNKIPDSPRRLRNRLASIGRFSNPYEQMNNIVPIEDLPTSPKENLEMGSPRSRRATVSNLNPADFTKGMNNPNYKVTGLNNPIEIKSNLVKINEETSENVSRTRKNSNSQNQPKMRNFSVKPYTNHDVFLLLFLYI